MKDLNEQIKELEKEIDYWQKSFKKLEDDIPRLMEESLFQIRKEILLKVVDFTEVLEKVLEHKPTEEIKQLVIKETKRLKEDLEKIK